MGYNLWLMFIFCNYITVYLLLCSTVGRTGRWWSLPCQPARVHIVFSQPIGGSGRWGAGRACPTLPPAARVLSFPVECCCLLALQEKVKRKTLLWRCVSLVCALFSRRPTSYLWKETTVFLRRERNGKNPPVHKENSSCRFLFSCNDQRLGRCPLLFLFFFSSLLVFFFFFVSPWRERRHEGYSEVIWTSA